MTEYSGQNNRITVMHVIGRLQIGGAERQLVALAPLLDPAKFRVIVVTLQGGGTLECELRDTQVESRSLNFRLRDILSAVYRLYVWLKQERVDVLHTHMYLAGLYGRIAGLFARVPVMITTDHGKGMWKCTRHLWWERLASRFTHLRIAVSEDIASILHEREHVPLPNLLVLGNGVDVEEFTPHPAARDLVRAEWGMDSDSVLIGTVARLVEAKALHHLIEAVASIGVSLPQVRLVIVGDGPLKWSLEDCAERLGVSEKILFAGSRSDIPAVLSAFDIFVLPSIREGLPVSLLEAMAAGKPVVATRVGGIPEVIRNAHNGLLVDPEDAQGLAAALCRLIEDPESAESMGRSGRQTIIEGYSLKAVAHELEAVYTVALLDRNTRGARPKKSTKARETAEP